MNERHRPMTQVHHVDPGAPYSEEAEVATLGAILLNPETYPEVSSFLKAEDFFFVRHQYIWQAFGHLLQDGATIDTTTTTHALEALGVADVVGGRAYLMGLVTRTPTSVHAQIYAHLVQKAALRRRLMQAADEIRDLARDETLNVEDVLTQSEGKLFSISDTHAKRDFVPMWDAISDYYERMEYLLAHQHESLGVPSGFRDMDALLGGFQKSDLIVFAGRPGMGKTSFLLTVAMNAARLGARVGIFTMEMGVEQMVQRMIAMETGINMQKLRLADLNQQEAARFTEVVGRIVNFPIFIDDTPALTPQDIRTKCRRLTHEHGLDMVMIDYMQLMNAGNAYANNRVQEISFISRNLKELARELNVPLISAAQLSRAVEQRQDKRPVLSDLRESGSIEQDSDVVMFLYRDEVYNEATEYPNQADILVSKHRNGPTGTISLYFEKSITKFMDATVHRVDLSDFDA